MICKSKKYPYICLSKTANGTLAEWLGNGLQNRVQQFDSARYLQQKSLLFGDFFVGGT